jgi:hypothetical protein
MAKYVMAGYTSNYVQNYHVGNDASEHAQESVENAVEYFFKRVSEERNSNNKEPLDPLEFMIKPEEFVLFIMDDNGIILCSMRLDYYLENCGSLTFDTENLNNSAQKPAEQT